MKHSYLFKKTCVRDLCNFNSVMPRTYKNACTCVLFNVLFSPLFNSKCAHILVVSILVHLSSLNILLFQVLSYHATASNKEVEVLLVS